MVEEIRSVSLSFEGCCQSHSSWLDPNSRWFTARPKDSRYETRMVSSIVSTNIGIISSTITLQRISGTLASTVPAKGRKRKRGLQAQGQTLLATWAPTLCNFAHGMNPPLNALFRFHGLCHGVSKRLTSVQVPGEGHKRSRTKDLHRPFATGQKAAR